MSIIISSALRGRGRPASALPDARFRLLLSAVVVYAPFCIGARERKGPGRGLSACPRRKRKAQNTSRGAGEENTTNAARLR